MVRRVRRILTFLLALSLLALVPEGYAFAEGGEFDAPELTAQADSVATVNGVGYETLQAAYEAVQEGETITLVNDIELTDSFWCEKTFTLDLNGCTLLNATESDDSVRQNTILVALDNHLTIKDSSESGAGMILNTSSNGYALYSQGNTTLESGTLKSENFCAALEFGQTLTINGGKVQGKTIGVRLNDSWETATVVINGGEISSEDEGASVVNDRDRGYIPDYFIINGGKFSDGAGNDYDSFSLLEGHNLQKGEGEEWYTLKPLDFSDIVYKASLSLDERIRVNLYMDNLPAGTNPAEYTIKFWMTGDEFSAYEEHPTNAESNYFKLVDFAAKEMCAPVHIRVYFKGELIKEVDYSVRDYCDKRIDESDDADLVALCQAVLDYGTYAQKHFGYNTDDLANANHSEETEERVTGATIPADFKAYVEKPIDHVPCLKSIAVSVSLDSQAVISFYLNPAAGSDLSELGIWVDDVQFRRDGEDVTGGRDVYNEATGAKVTVTDLEDGRILVQIGDGDDGIAPKHYGHAFRLDVVDRTGTTAKGNTVKYSVLSYAYSKQGKTTKGLGNLCKALYNYYVAAEAYL